MPQMNSDEASIDEPKTYTAENFEEDQRWHESDNLSDIKGDLVGDLDGESRIPNGNQSKVNNHSHVDANKDNLERDSRDDSKGPGRPNYFPHAPDFGAIVSGLNGHHLFPNGGIPTSSKVSPYHPYNLPNPYVLYGGTPPSEIDPKTGLPRSHQDIPSMYSLPGNLGQIPHPLAPWVGPGASMYPICTASTIASIMRYQHPFAAAFSGTSGASVANMQRFPLGTPPGMHPSMLHPALSNGGMPGMGNGHHPKHPKSENPGHPREKPEKPSRPYVKKPLNAFMLYMKEQRAKVVAECTLKESAAINQILGRKWHSLSREEQQKYYEMARKERQLHMQLYPGWSARDNYGKRKKRKKEKNQGECTAQNPKKCRAVFGLDQQQLWCAPCRRKKKCIRYQHDGDDSGSEYEDMGSPTSPPPMQDNFNQRRPNNPFDAMINNPVTSQPPIINGGGLHQNGLTNGNGGSYARPPSQSPPQQGLKVKEEIRTSPDVVNRGSNNYNDPFSRSKSHGKDKLMKHQENGSPQSGTNSGNQASNNNNSNTGLFNPHMTSESSHPPQSAANPYSVNNQLSQHASSNDSVPCNSNHSTKTSTSVSCLQDSGHSSLSSNSSSSPSSRVSEKSRLSDQNNSFRDSNSYKSSTGNTPITPRVHSTMNHNGSNPFFAPQSGSSPLMSPNSMGFNPNSPHTSATHNPFLPPFSPYLQMQIAAANLMGPSPSPLGLASLNGLSPMIGGLNSVSPGQGSSAGHGGQSSRHHGSAVEGKS